MRALITGSAGLIGSEAALFFAERGYSNVGIDNDMRRYFFGAEASTAWNRQRLQEELKDKYAHFPADIRDNEEVEKIFQKNKFDVFIPRPNLAMIGLLKSRLPILP